MVCLHVFSDFFQSQALAPHYINLLVKVGSSTISTLSLQRRHSWNLLFPLLGLFFLKWICCCYCVWVRVSHSPGWARRYYVAADDPELLDLLPHFLSSGISGMPVPMETIVNCWTRVLGTDHVLPQLALIYFVSIKCPNVFKDPGRQVI